MELKEKLSLLLRETYNELKNKKHKNPHSYNIGGNSYACVSDKLEINNNSIVIGGVYDFEIVKDLYNKIKEIILLYLPNATMFAHNIANYPQEDIWEEYSVDGKLIISIQWKYGHSYSVISYK